VAVGALAVFAAMTVAGLDGIKNKLKPGDAIDKALYDLPPRELKKIPTVCGSLRQALGELVPQGRCRIRLPRQLYRSEDVRRYPLRAHAASGRIRNVLFGVTFVADRKTLEGRSAERPFC